MVNLLRPLLTAVAERQQRHFSRQTRQSLAVQERFLCQLLKRYSQTALGREYRLSEVKNIETFRDRLPVANYARYEPYIERIARGEENVLTSDAVVFFNTTSGSTGKQKLIPVTRRFQNSLGKANLASIGFLSRGLRDRGASFGKLLLTNGAKIAGQTPSGIAYGPGGTGVLRMGKLVYEQLFAHPFDTLRPQDSLARHYLSILFALQERAMGGMAANFPMLILRICDYLDRYSDDFIRDIETGTIASWLQVEPEIRRVLEKRWSANPQRAQELRQVRDRDGRLKATRAWPNLSYIGTARGGTSGFYLERFPEYLEDTPVFGAVYATSEGTFSIYPDLDSDGSVLAVDTGFFEFIPQDQWDEEHPKTLLATEVKVGEHYRVLMSNYSGFYRYDVGDVVEVVGFYESAPLIVFRYRRGGIISSTVEKTTEAHATAVMQGLHREFNLALTDFCITLSEKEFPAHYILNIELAPGQKLENPEQFIRRFDEQLSIINPRYGAKRQEMVPPPRLHILAPGSFAVVHQRQLKRGVPDFQMKFPHISEDRELVKGLDVLYSLELPEKVSV